MAFKPKVTSFGEVTVRLRQIGRYLDSVSASLKRLRWDLLPKKKKRRRRGGGGGGGGQDAGSKPPKGWPP